MISWQWQWRGGGGRRKEEGGGRDFFAGARVEEAKEKGEREVYGCRHGWSVAKARGLDELLLFLCLRRLECSLGWRKLMQPQPSVLHEITSRPAALI